MKVEEEAVEAIRLFHAFKVHYLEAGVAPGALWEVLRLVPG